LPDPKVIRVWQAWSALKDPQDSRDHPEPRARKVRRDLPVHRDPRVTPAPSDLREKWDLLDLPDRLARRDLPDPRAGQARPDRRVRRDRKAPQDPLARPGP
jgi:hypothetical protein